MKKLINDPYKVCDEMIEGYVAAYGAHLRKVDGCNVIVRKAMSIENRVGVVIGGGSGHEPLFIGLVGKGMGDAAAPGDIFAAPSPDVIIEAVRAVDSGAGVLFVYGNYAGDNMNFDMAAEMAEAEGYRVETVRVWDDVASAPIERQDERRGIAGDVFVIKMAGAKAETGASLDEVKAVTEKARQNTRTIGVALSSATIPATGEPTFDIGYDEMEIGMGLHGEPGVGRQKLMSADETAEQMTERVLADLPFVSGDEVVVLVNGLGSTTLMELYIINRKVAQVLAAKGIEIYDTTVGTFCTCQEMAGCSVTLMKLDDELKELYKMPAWSTVYKRFSHGMFKGE
ncbi:dihydroxyacetone kinase subunit DhaK [Candidatus Hydrogenedentota bacterium]